MSLTLSAGHRQSNRIPSQNREQVLNGVLPAKHGIVKQCMFHTRSVLDQSLSVVSLTDARMSLI